MALFSPIFFGITPDDPEELHDQLEVNARVGALLVAEALYIHRQVHLKKD